jgi:hypothetical protein
MKLMFERKDLSQHILPTSAQLVGVCMTVISLVKLLHIGQAGSLLDKLLAIDALLFTISAALSYASMRGAISEKQKNSPTSFLCLVCLNWVVVPSFCRLK